MRPILVLVVLLLALTGCGASTTAPEVGTEVTRAALAAAGANLAIWYQTHGTYVGAAVGVDSVRLVRADTTAYCIQAADSHEDGPLGGVRPGPCA